MKTRTAGGVVVGQDGRILVVNQQRHSWSLPKGHIDKGEKALEAARREIFEESGVKDLKLICKLGQYERYKIGLKTADDRSELKQIVMYLFKTRDEELKPQDPDNPEARWVRLEEVADLLTHAKDSEFFRSVIPQVAECMKKV